MNTGSDACNTKGCGSAKAVLNVAFNEDKRELSER